MGHALRNVSPTTRLGIYVQPVEVTTWAAVNAWTQSVLGPDAAAPAQQADNGSAAKAEAKAEATAQAHGALNSGSCSTQPETKIQLPHSTKKVEWATRRGSG